VARSSRLTRYSSSTLCGREKGWRGRRRRRRRRKRGEKEKERDAVRLCEAQHR